MRKRRSRISTSRWVMSADFIRIEFQRQRQMVRGTPSFEVIKLVAVKRAESRDYFSGHV